MAGWMLSRRPGRDGHSCRGIVILHLLAERDIHAEHPHGLFVRDTRILSGWNLSINGEPLEPLAAEQEP